MADRGFADDLSETMLRLDFNAVLDKLIGPRDLHARAIETKVLHPAETIETKPAIFVDDLSLVTAVAPGIGLQERIEHMRGGVRELPPSMGYRFKNLRVAQGRAYVGRGSELIRIENRKLIHSFEPIHIGSPAAIVCNRSSTHVYGHWIVDQLVRELVAGEMGVEAVTLPSVKEWTHEVAVRKLVGLEATKGNAFILDDGWIYEDRPKNTFYGEHFRVIRDRSRYVGDDAAEAPRRVYLRRGSLLGEKRALSNEEQVSTLLEGLGFTIVDVEKASIPELRHKLSRSEVTCTMEGSQAVHHFQFAPSDSTLLLFMPQDRFNHILKEYCDVLGMRLAFVMCTTTAQQEYEVLIESLRRVLEEVDKQS